MQNLKNNTRQLNLLKRRSLIESFLTEIAFNANVKELLYGMNKRNDFIISCNGNKKTFPFNTPVNFIKSEIYNCILNDTPKSEFYAKSLPEESLFSNSESLNSNYYRKAI
ncbi:MAG TPA: hypothetical protein VHP32_09280 [Ignavibacteria bacterium]|nr:hypothetical protein [Ignavibacteria bacterium]